MEVSLDPRLILQTATVTALFLSASFDAAGASEFNPPLSSEENALIPVDNDFRSLYQDNKDEIKKSLGPILFYGDGKLVLRNGQARNEIPFRLPLYDILKTIDHVPLALFVLLENSCDQPLTDLKLRYLSGLAKDAESTNNTLEKLHLTPIEYNRQHRILVSSIDLAKQAVFTKRVSKAQLQKFANDLGPLSLQNVEQACGIELANLDKMVHQITKDLSKDDRKRLHAIILGEHMPHVRNAALQYFEALFGDEAEGHRVIYCEGPADEDKGIELLATHILDARIGKAFFDDPERMHRDLLSDAASRYLSEHKPAPL